MGGWEKITSFRISKRRPAESCASTVVDIDGLATGNGVRLGQTLEAFKNSFPVKFKRNGSKLIYQAVSKRAATDEELKSIRARWPNEKQVYFDVTVEINAKFDGDRLIDFYASTFESL